jgi:hypothetical protein
LALVQNFFAYDASFSGGVTVAAKDADGDGRVDLVTGAGAGTAEPVRLFLTGGLTVNLTEPEVTGMTVG